MGRFMLLGHTGRLLERKQVFTYWQPVARGIEILGEI